MMRISLTKNMPALRAAAKQRIDSQAEAIRLNYITAGAGQAMAYQEKYEEAVALIQNPSLGAADLPHIFAEVGITAATAEDVAQVVIGMRAAWKTISAEIEQRRLSAKASIDAATHPAEIQAVLSAYGA